VVGAGALPGAVALPGTATPLGSAERVVVDLDPDFLRSVRDYRRGSDEGLATWTWVPELEPGIGQFGLVVAEGEHVDMLFRDLTRTQETRRPSLVGHGGFVILLGCDLPPPTPDDTWTWWAYCADESGPSLFAPVGAKKTNCFLLGQRVAIGEEGVPPRTAGYAISRIPDLSRS